MGGGGRGVVYLGSGSGKEAKAERVDVEEEVLADELIGGGEGDSVEVVEEAVEAAGLSGEDRGGISMEGVGAVALAGVGEPGGAVDDEVLVVAAEGDEEEAVVSELAEAVVGAVEVVDGVAGTEVLVEMSEEVDLVHTIINQNSVISNQQSVISIQYATFNMPVFSIHYKEGIKESQCQ